MNPDRHAMNPVIHLCTCRRHCRRQSPDTCLLTAALFFLGLGLGILAAVLVYLITA